MVRHMAFNSVQRRGQPSISGLPWPLNSIKIREVNRQIFAADVFAPPVYRLLAFVMIYIVYDLFYNLPDFIEGRTPLLLVAKYYFILMPSVLVRIVPISLLLAVRSPPYGLTKIRKTDRDARERRKPDPAHDPFCCRWRAGFSGRSRRNGKILRPAPHLAPVVLAQQKGPTTTSTFTKKRWPFPC